jgi:O-antigen/teichoic acid export membrane protein
MHRSVALVSASRDRRTLTRSTLLDAAALSAVGLLSKAIGLVVSVLVARFLGPEGLGLFAMLFAAAMLLEEVSNFGLPDLLLRQVAARPELAGGYWRQGLRSAVLTSLVTSAGLAVAAVMTNDRPDMRNSLALIALSMPLAAASRIGQSVLQAKRDVPFVTVANFVSAVASLVLLFVFLHGGLGVVAAFASRLVFLTTLVIAFSFRIRGLHGAAAAAPLTEPLLRQSFPFAIARALNEAGMRVSLLVVSVLFALADVGLFDAGDRLGLSLRAVAGSGIIALIPIFSRSVALNDSDKDHLVAYSIKYVFLVAAGGAFVVAAFADLVMHVLFGAHFASTADLLPALLLAQAFGVADAVVRQALIAHGREYSVIGTSLTTLLLRAGFIALLSLPFGLQGAACGVLASAVITLAVNLFVAGRSGMSLEVARHVVRPAICVLAAFVPLWVLHDRPALLALGAGAVAFAAFAFLLRLFPMREIGFVRDSIRLRTGRAIDHET